MPTTANTIIYYVAADGTLRDGENGSIAQQPRINYGTEYAVTLSFPPSTIAEGDQLQVALNRTRTFFSSASATGDAPVAAVVKHDVTAEEATAQAVTLTLSTNTRAMIDQVNGIDHPVRGFFGVHILRGQSFVTLAVADALMMSLESGPDAISPSLPVVDYPTREEAEALTERSEAAAGRAETAQGKAEEAQGKAETAKDNAQIWAEGTDQQVEELGGEHSAKEYDRLAGVSATNAGKSATDAGNAQMAAETAQEKAEDAQVAAGTAQANAAKIAEGSDADVAPLGLEHSAKGWAQEAEATLGSKRDILQTLVTSSSTALEVEAGKSYNWTVAAASTIALAAADKVAGKETRIDIYIDLQDGGSVTGDGVAVADAVLQSGWYKLIWDGTNATLYSTKAGGAASVITIPSSTTSYTLQDNKHYQQVPDNIPTYTLPTASFDGLVHEITVLVDFMHVTSCSFVDAGGVPVTLQSAISPQIGEAYIFRCYWYGKWRVVPLKIRNAATATSATGVVEVSDAVAGDALALKMVAPRSVVVNQLVQYDGYVASAASNYGTVSVSGNSATLTITTEINSNGILFRPVANGASDFVKASHTYIIAGYCTVSSATTLRFMYSSVASITSASKASVEANSKTFVSMKTTMTANLASIYVYASDNGNFPLNGTMTLEDAMCVDLTQYFNGDQTLIDSIQTWDDLVAYDPRFASYVEYNTGTVTGVQPTVKVTGKNLFDQSTILTDVAESTYANGYYSFKNKAGTTAYGRKAGGIFHGKFKTATQYTISATGYSESSGAYPRFIFLYTDGTTTQVPQSFTTEESRKSLTSENGKTVSAVLFDYSTNQDSLIYLKDIQLEIGSTATAYEPYHDGGTAQAPAPLFAVGNAADEFEAVSGMLTHQLQYLVLNGTENEWQKNADYNDYVSFYLSKAYLMAKIDSAYGAVCDKFIYSQWQYIQNSDGEYLWEAGSSIGFRINKSRLSNYDSLTTNVERIAAFKTWLSSNNIILCYVLATPTTSQSTPTQISLQAGSNVAMQTDGGRTLAELAMTYENLPTEG